MGKTKARQEMGDSLLKLIDILKLIRGIRENDRKFFKMRKFPIMQKDGAMREEKRFLSKGLIQEVQWPTNKNLRNRLQRRENYQRSNGFPKTGEPGLQSQRTCPEKGMKKRSTLSHIFITFQNTKDEEKILKVSRENSKKKSLTIKILESEWQQNSHEQHRMLKDTGMMPSIF